MITCYEDGWDTPHEGQMGACHTLTQEDAEYDPVYELLAVVKEVTGYEPDRPVFRFGFL